MTMTLDQINPQIVKTGERLYLTAMSGKARQIVEALSNRVTVEPDGQGGMYLHVRERAIYTNDTKAEILPDLTCSNNRMRGDTGLQVWYLWVTRGEGFPDSLWGERLFLLVGFGKSVLTTEIPLAKLQEVEQ